MEGQTGKGKEKMKKLCECGCGQAVSRRFIHGHSGHKWKAREVSKFARKHGHTSAGKTSGTYISWASMCQRCTNPKHQHWKHYGAKGILICKRWLNSFENFLADMGKRPKGTTLGRFKDKGNYIPTNCRWMTRAEQRETMGKLHTPQVLSIRRRYPKKATVKQLAKEYGVSISAVYAVLSRTNFKHIE